MGQVNTKKVLTDAQEMTSKTGHIMSGKLPIKANITVIHL